MRLRRRLGRRIAREAFANTAARPLLTTGLVVVVAALTLGATVTEVLSATSTRRYADDLVANGWATLVVDYQKQDGTGLTADDCRNLADITGVRAFVFLREPTELALAASPELNVQVWPAGGPVPEFFQAVKVQSISQHRIGALFVDVGSTYASSRNVEYPIRVRINGKTDAIWATTIDLASLGAGFEGAALAIDNRPGTISACALAVDPNARFEVVASVDAAFPSTEGFGSRWALSGADRFEHPRSRFEARTSQHYWAVAALVAGAMIAMLQRLRRADYALYSITGLSRMRTATLILYESLLVAIPAIGFGLAVLTVAGARRAVSNSDLSAGLASGVRLAIAVTLLSAAAAWLTATRAATGTVSALKDR